MSLFVDNGNPSRRVYSQRKEFAPIGANSFLKEVTPIEKEGKNENG